MKQGKRKGLIAALFIGLLVMLWLSCGENKGDRQGNLNLELVFPEIENSNNRSDMKSQAVNWAIIGSLEVYAFIGSIGAEDSPDVTQKFYNPGRADYIEIKIDIDVAQWVYFIINAKGKGQETTTLYIGYTKAWINPTASNIVVITMMTDHDGDGFFPKNPAISDPVFLNVLSDLDCNDLNTNIYPYNSNQYCDCDWNSYPPIAENPSYENCTDEADNDCDGDADQQDSDCCNDNDGDGYGAPASSYCPYSDLDCLDSNQNVNPGSYEGLDSPQTCTDRLDNDCDGYMDEEDGACVAGP